ncbi:MAG: hypothetical protein GY797_38315 [Deltaproteobacteria bacterium]|nr:hypothetical protein [Deltaproteobacteria bacterium]
METAISIIGFVLSVGAFFPFLLLKDKRRDIAVIALISAFCIVTAWYAYQRYQYDKELNYVRNMLLTELAERDLTFEDMQQYLGDIETAVIADAIHKMLRNNVVFSDVSELHNIHGQSFDVRLYRVARMGKQK